MAAEVSFDDAQAIVTVRPDRVGGEDLVLAVEDAGFEARVIEDGPADPSRASRTRMEES